MKARLPIIIAMILLVGGCSLFQKKDDTTMPELNTGKDVAQAQSIVEKSTKEIGKATQDIAEETQAIKKETDKTRVKIPPEVKASIDPHLDKINDSTNTISKNTQDINKSVAELAGATSLLDNAGEKVSSLENALVKITKERDDARKAEEEALKAKNSQLHESIRWVIIGTMILTGVFSVLFFMHGSKFGLTGAAICAVVCVIAIFIETYFIYVAIAGGIMFLILIGALVYNVFIKNKAFTEAVETVEVTKDNLSKKAKEKLFGGEGETGLMNTIQSQSTMALVKKEKSKMAKLWSYAKKKTGEIGKDE